MSNLLTYIIIKSTLVLNSIIAKVSISSLLAAVLLFFAPISLIVHITVLAVFIDFISGFAAALKTKQKITSFRIRDTLIKLLLYILLIMLVYGIQVACLWNLNIVNLVAAFILFNETVSIAENIDKFIGNSKLSKFVKSLKDKFLNPKNENKNENI